MQIYAVFMKGYNMSSVPEFTSRQNLKERTENLFLNDFLSYVDSIPEFDDQDRSVMKEMARHTVSNNGKSLRSWLLLQSFKQSACGQELPGGGRSRFIFGCC
jgi:hypothetical protein